MIKSIAFSPTDYLCAVHGDGSHFGGRVAAFTNLLFPFHPRRKQIVSSFVVFDAVVTDHNPFLAAFALRRLVEEGKRPLLVISDDVDEWPYDLLFSTPMASFLASIGQQPEDFEDDPVPVPSRIISGLLSGVSSDITISRQFGGLHMSARQPTSKLALFGNDRLRGSSNETTAEIAALKGSLLSALQTAPSLSLPKWGKLALFTERLILTGRPENFAHTQQRGAYLDWGNPRVTPMGSAQFANRTSPEAARMLIEELLRLHQIDFQSAA